MSIFSGIAEAVLGVSQSEWDSEEYQSQYCQEDEPLTIADHVDSCNNLDDSIDDPVDDSDIETASSWFSWLGL